jgi:hypothetical protein
MWYFTAWDNVHEDRAGETVHIFDNKEQALAVWEDLNGFHTVSPLTEVPGCEVSVPIDERRFFFYGRQTL